MICMALLKQSAICGEYNVNGAHFINRNLFSIRIMELMEIDLHRCPLLFLITEPISFIIHYPT